VFILSYFPFLLALPSPCPVISRSTHTKHVADDGGILREGAGDRGYEDKHLGAKGFGEFNPHNGDTQAGGRHDREHRLNHNEQAAVGMRMLSTPLVSGNAKGMGARNPLLPENKVVYSGYNVVNGLDQSYRQDNPNHYKERPVPHPSNMVGRPPVKYSEVMTDTVVRVGNAAIPTIPFDQFRYFRTWEGVCRHAGQARPGLKSGASGTLT
jgi:hypothetical protein